MLQLQYLIHLSLTTKQLQMLQLWVMSLITTSLLQPRKQTLISNFHQNITQTTYLIQTQIHFSLLQLTNISLYYFISSLDSHISSSPNSISVKILKLQKNDISQQLSDILVCLSRLDNLPQSWKWLKSFLYIKSNQELYINILSI